MIGWTIDTLSAHIQALREADARFYAERDRRYAEVALEREKALKIKEAADDNALRLAREIQTYKDTQAHELREQIGSERGLYVTKNEMTGIVGKFEEQIKPLYEYVASQQGRSGGLNAGWGYLVGAIGLAGGLIGIFFALSK